VRLDLREKRVKPECQACLEPREIRGSSVIKDNREWKEPLESQEKRENLVHPPRENQAQMPKEKKAWRELTEKTVKWEDQDLKERLEHKETRELLGKLANLANLVNLD